jgi:predicted ArsR family transcriptional regulator
MRKSLVFGAGQGARLALLDLIKRSENGLGVKEIAAELGMSYMGVKAHCLALASEGYLNTWRQPAPKGRPLMFYRLSESGELLFAEPGLGLAIGLLRDAGKLFGATAPQKLLALYFRNEAERYRAMISSLESAERVRAFVRLRNREERMAVLRIDGQAWEIQESHHPEANLIREYPEAAALEQTMVGEVLGVSILRRQQGGKIVFSPC